MESSDSTVATQNTDNGVIGYSVVSHILVMDDEELIRNLAVSMLNNLGYTATACANGKEAVEHYKLARESGTPYSAVIMDLIVPGGMGGKEAAQQILKIDPNATLIVSSGYSDDGVMANYRSHGFRGLLRKPYKLSELASVLAALM